MLCKFCGVLKWGGPPPRGVGPPPRGVGPPPRWVGPAGAAAWGRCQNDDVGRLHMWAGAPVCVRKRF